jgi:hypothetical protein
LPFLTFLLISLSISTYCKGEMLPEATGFGLAETHLRCVLAYLPFLPSGAIRIS